MPNIIEVLESRGFVDAITSDELRATTKQPLKIYCGFDPTADSLHLGNMVAIMGLAWFQRMGHTPYIIIGGATGMVGDPSGKSHERPLLDEETIQNNLDGIRKNFAQILDFDHPTAKPVILNNYDWFKKFSFIDFLRDVGKNFRMGPMLAKESVRARLKSEEGMSFTEFSYQLLQGYDFLHLYDNNGVTAQIGGSDQWGNITAGKDLVRKMRGVSVHGVTFPLLTSSDGKKFGKSEKGALWLSPEKCSPYQFYQYLVRVADADVCKLMRMLTFMDMEEIDKYEEEMKSSEYVPNTAQRRLAEAVTRIVHGEKGLEAALKATKAAAPGSKAILDVESLENIAADIPNKEIEKTKLLDQKLIDIIVGMELLKSKGEVRRLIKNGGISLNNHKVFDENQLIQPENLIDGRLLLLAIGKKNKVLVRVKE